MRVPPKRCEVCNGKYAARTDHRLREERMLCPECEIARSEAAASAMMDWDDEHPARKKPKPRKAKK